MVRILVDSSSDYSLDEVKQKNMEFVPITVTIGEKSYVDGVDLERNTFYELLEASGEFPKTSQPSPQAFLDIFKEVKEKGDEMVCILLSSALSETYQSAVLAKQMADYEKIYIVDSLSATYVIKVLAEYACNLCENGLEAGEIAEQVEALKSRVKVIAALDTLEYLSRGGRIGKAAALIGDMANIKPIITVTEEGVVGVLGKCIGRNKAISTMLKLLNAKKIDTDFPMYAIYSYGVENCEKFEEKLRKEGYQINEQLQIGSTIGAHIGPEAFGVVYVEK